MVEATTSEITAEGEVVGEDKDDNNADVKVAEDVATVEEDNTTNTPADVKESDV